MIDYGSPGRQTLVAMITALSNALDLDDFTAAARFLASDCEYDDGAGTHTGPAAVLASFADSSKRLRAAADDVRIESEIQEMSDRTATVRSTYYLVKAGGSFHRYRRIHELTANADGLVARVVQRELPGEREALAAFLRRT